MLTSDLEILQYFSKQHVNGALTNKTLPQRLLRQRGVILTRLCRNSFLRDVVRSYDETRMKQMRIIRQNEEKRRTATVENRKSFIVESRVGQKKSYPNSILRWINVQISVNLFSALIQRQCTVHGLKKVSFFDKLLVYIL